MKKHLSIFGICILLFGFIQTIHSQNLKDDPYARLCLKFVQELFSDGEIEKVENYFDESIRNDSLRIKLSACRQEIKNATKYIEFYITKFRKYDLFFYNINIHNPKVQKTYGDLRVLFEEKNDYLIDDWVFFSADLKEDNEKQLTIKLPIPPP